MPIVDVTANTDGSWEITGKARDVRRAVHWLGRDTEKMGNYVIIAPNYNLALHYAQIHGLSKKHWKYITSDDQLLWLSRDTTVLWLTHDKNGDIEYDFDSATYKRIFFRMKELMEAKRIEVQSIAFEDAP